MISKDEGSKKAPIVLVGEAFGRWEEIYQRPFCGPSYNDKLLPWWQDCTPKIDRSMVYITNAYDQGQPQPHIDRISEHEMRASIDRLHERLALLEGPDGGGPIVIVPVGNVALYALTGNGKVSWHRKDGRHDRPGIKDWRGSILQYVDRRGRKIKVIPSVHPASTFYSDVGLEWALRADWQRIAEDAQFRELRLPQYTKMIGPSKAEAIEWMRWTRGEAEVRKGGELYTGRLACSLDVETPYKVEYETRQAESKSTAVTAKCRTCGHTKRWHEEKSCNDVHPTCDVFHPEGGHGVCAGLRGKGGCECGGFQGALGKPKRIKIREEAYLGCIGYSWDPKLALCIPTTLEYWQDPAVWAVVKAEMAEFHADANIDFGGQNFGFDAWWCAEEDVPLHAIGWDLMKMHRVQRPWSESHDLAFQASIDTRHPFWKHEAKLPDEVSRWSHNKEQLWAYNCTDNVVQRTLLDKRVTALKAEGRFDYYQHIEAPIDDGLLELSRWGIRVDVEGRAKHYEKTINEAQQVGREINAAAGFDADCKHRKCDCLVKKIAVGGKPLQKFLYETLRLPIQYTKNAMKKKVVSVNVVTIKRLCEQFPTVEALQKVGALVLKHRRLNVEANFVKESGVCKDGRVRAIFKQDTLLGRLSSSRTPKKEGRNLQNIDRKLRKLYLPDTGEEIVT